MSYQFSDFDAGLLRHSRHLSEAFLALASHLRFLPSLSVDGAAQGFLGPALRRSGVGHLRQQAGPFAAAQQRPSAAAAVTVDLVAELRAAAFQLVTEALYLALLSRRHTRRLRRTALSHLPVKQSNHLLVLLIFSDGTKLMNYQLNSVRIRWLEIGGVAQWLGRRSVAGGLTLIYA